MTTPLCFTLSVEANGLPPVILQAVATAAERTTRERGEDTSDEAVVLYLMQSLVEEVTKLPEILDASCDIQGTDDTGAVVLKLSLRLQPSPLQHITIRPFDPSMN